MNIEIAKRVSELLRKKSDYERDLAELVDPDSRFVLGRTFHGSWSGPSSLNINNDKELNKKYRDLLITDVKIKIISIDNEIKNISCF